MPPYFDYSFISFSLGYEKPDINAFLKVIDEIQTEPESLLYVGNDYEEDYLPAQSLNIDTLLLKRGDHIDVDHTIKCIPSLENIFQHLD